MSIIFHDDKNQYPCEACTHGNGRFELFIQPEVDPGCHQLPANKIPLCRACSMKLAMQILGVFDRWVDECGRKD